MNQRKYVHQQNNNNSRKEIIVLKICFLSILKKIEIVKIKIMQIQEI